MSSMCLECNMESMLEIPCLDSMFMPRVLSIFFENDVIFEGANSLSIMGATTPSTSISRPIFKSVFASARPIFRFNQDPPYLLTSVVFVHFWGERLHLQIKFSHQPHHTFLAMIDFVAFT